MSVGLVKVFNSRSNAADCEVDRYDIVVFEYCSLHGNN